MEKRTLRGEPFTGFTTVNGSFFIRSPDGDA